MAALGGGGILYEMCKKAMITKNYKVKDSMIAKLVKTKKLQINLEIEYKYKKSRNCS